MNGSYIQTMAPKRRKARRANKLINSGRIVKSDNQPFISFLSALLEFHQDIHSYLSIQSAPVEKILAASESRGNREAPSLIRHH